MLSTGRKDVASGPSATSNLFSASASPRPPASNVLITAKRTFVRVLRGLVGEYEQDETQIDAEIADLQKVLARRE